VTPGFPSASTRFAALALLLAACAVKRTGQANPDAADGGPRRDAALDLDRARCGNRVRDEGEECDGISLGGARCETVGFVLGELDCRPDCTFDTSACRRPPPDWRDVACPYRRIVTVPGGRAAEAISDFPLLISLEDEGIRDHALPAGEDLFFADAESGVRLPHTREFSDPSTGMLAAWVRVPLGGADETRLHLYYGDALCGAANPNVPTGTWDADFRGVWLLTEDGTMPLRDATVSGFDATRGDYDGDEDVPGRLGGAEQLDGMDDHLAVPVEVLEGLRTFTICTWLRTDENRNNATDWKNPTIFGQISTGFESADFGFFTSSGRVGLRSGLCAGADELAVSTTTLNDGSFHQVCAVGGPDSTLVTVDDVTVATICPVMKRLAPPAFWLGGQRGQTPAETGSHHRGDYDHLEVSGVVRSPAWRSARFANQRDPAGFAIVGPEETW
jgi:hypothetical protein